MCVYHGKPSVMKDLYAPAFHLGHLKIKLADEETYLECIINTDISNDHIIKEIRNICARGNTLIRNFKHCRVHVKIILLKTYCSNFICFSMWIQFCKKYYYKSTYCL